MDGWVQEEEEKETVVARSAQKVYDRQNVADQTIFCHTRRYTTEDSSTDCAVSSASTIQQRATLLLYATISPMIYLFAISSREDAEQSTEFAGGGGYIL